MSFLRSQRLWLECGDAAVGRVVSEVFALRSQASLTGVVAAETATQLLRFTAAIVLCCSLEDAEASPAIAKYLFALLHTTDVCVLGMTAVSLWRLSAWPDNREVLCASSTGPLVSLLLWWCHTLLALALPGLDPHRALELSSDSLAYVTTSTQRCVFCLSCRYSLRSLLARA